jgi:hypothetical protein
MPRDGDPMSLTFDGSVPLVFHANSAPGAVPARSIAGGRPRRPPRPGQRSILLSARNARGGGVLLVFTRSRGGIRFWRSLSPERSRLDHVATFPGPFTPRAVAQLLASGAARPAIDTAVAGDAEIDGVEGLDAGLLRMAWSRTEGRPDPRLAPLLRIPGPVLAGVAERMGWEDLEDLLHLGDQVLKGNAAWLARWHAEIDAEVDRRASVTGAGETGRRAVRAFVEECLLTLGRLPRSDETDERWDGIAVRDREPTDAQRRKLGMRRAGRSGRFHVWVRFWTAAEACGRADFGGGPGWYWDVTNPDPGWLVNGVMGPCKSSQEAWEEVAWLQNEGE